MGVYESWQDVSAGETVSLNLGAFRKRDLTLLPNGNNLGAMGNHDAVLHGLGAGTVDEYFCLNNVNEVRVEGHRAAGLQPVALLVKALRRYCYAWFIIQGSTPSPDLGRGLAAVVIDNLAR